MECLKCKAEIDDSGQCPNCGFDMDIYMKVKSISDRLYNQGLEYAKNQNLSSAIEFLNRSVKYDKTNYLARNVLGLIYFEIGEISKALKEWIISNAFVKENNLAHQYIDAVQNSSNKLEKYNNSIKMYNQALVYANQKSEDMAIIQLKKALEINPKFLDAYNLLALCYISTKENEKAISCIERALEIDIANPKALKYYMEVKGSSQRNLKVDKPQKAAPAAKYSSSSSTIVNKGNTFGQITSFVVGAICTVIVMLVLIMPSIKSNYQTQIKQLTENNGKLENKLNTTIAENEKTISQLQQENERLIGENQQINSDLKEKEQIQKVQQASTLYENGNKEDSYILLKSIENVVNSFPEETRLIYESLVEKVYPDMAKTYYNDGLRSYNTRKYDEARTLFEKSYAVMTDQSFSDDALYYIARIDEINENKENAKLLYQRLMDDYPKSNMYYNARSRLANLG